jgi:hypothetical protein
MHESVSSIRTTLTRVAFIVVISGFAGAQPTHDSGHNGSQTTHSAVGELNRPACVPIAQRGGREIGCYILLSEALGQLPAK